MIPVFRADPLLEAEGRLRGCLEETGPGGAEEAHTALHEARDLLADYRARIRGQDGFAQEVQSAAPHLTPTLDHLVAVLDALVADTGMLVERCERGEDVRAAVQELTERLTQLRYREGEALLDAFEVDVASAD